MIRGALQRARELVDQHVPVAGKLARHFWVEGTNVRQRFGNRAHPVAPQGQWAIQELRRTGTSVVERYLPADRCADLRATIDQLLDTHRERVWSDDVGSDHRLYGADRVSGPIRALYEDAFVRSTLEAYERSADVRGFALAARMDAKPNNPGSGVGWHRDNALQSQAKAIYYLSDVTAANGPFEYLPGSHRPHRIALDMVTVGAEPGQRRFSDASIASLEAGWPGYQRQTVCAPEGSVLLADTRGLHRGSPIVDGSRYAVTVYLWFDQPIPDHVAQLLVDARDAS